MSNYTKTTNFATKDALASGNPAKIVKGTEIDTEFNNIAVASSTKANKASPVFTGTATLPVTNASSLSIGGDGVTVTGIKDEDDMASNSATKLASQQSIKAYVDSQVTAQDLDVTDGTNTIAIDLDSEALSLLGGTGVTSTASGNGVTMAIDGTVATLTGTQTLTNKTLTTPVISGNLTTDGNIDGRDVATDGTKLDTVETNADVTDTVNVTAAGALMDSEVTNLAEVKAFDSADYATAAQGTTADAALPKAGGAMTGAITTNSTFDGRDVATDGTKLDGIEALADVTDATNVTAAGALMDSEVTNLAQVKAFDSSDYATAAQGTTADSALQDVVDDTTPQLGGDLDTNGNDVKFADNDKATFGAGDDLQIYSDGTNAIIKEDTGGSLYIGGADVHLMNPAFTEYYISAAANGAVTLRHDNAIKLATTSTGIDVTGNLQATGYLAVDGTSGTTGAGTDRWIGGDGTAGTWFYNVPTGSNHYFAVNNANKLAVNSTGIDVIGTATMDGLTVSKTADGVAASIGKSGGTNLNIYTDTNTVYLAGSAALANAYIIDETNNTMQFKVNAAERMRIDSSGNVGIGTSAPSYKLDLNGDMRFTSGSAMFWADTNVYEGRTGNDRYWVTGGSERMRIDSSGHLLVGTTSLSPAVDGFRAYNSGQTITTTNNAPAQYLNRRTSDGEIVVFRKDNATVGSIGVKSSDLYIGTGDTGLAFYDYSTENAILPHNPATNVFTDASIDLGRGTSGSAYRFKDLYLSGGVYLGGTGAANKLDDYEQGGTFNPTIDGNTTTGVGTYTVQVGEYTKVGNLVTVDIKLIWTAHTGAGTGIRIGGLPFTSSAAASGMLVGNMSNVTMTAGSHFAGALIRASTIQADCFQQGGGGVALALIPFDTAGACNLTGQYYV